MEANNCTIKLLFTERTDLGLFIENAESSLKHYYKGKIKIEGKSVDVHYNTLKFELSFNNFENVLSFLASILQNYEQDTEKIEIS